MNEALFEEIYREYYSRIFSYCYSRTKSKDVSVSIANDTFLLLRDKWHSLDFDEHYDKIFIWLLKTVIIKTKEYLRTHREHFKVESIDKYSDFLSEPLSVQNIFSTNQSIAYQEYLFEIKKRLHNSEAELFELLVIRKLKQKEVAELLGISVGAVKMKWYRLKPKIKKIIFKIKEEF